MKILHLILRKFFSDILDFLLNICMLHHNPNSLVELHVSFHIAVLRLFVGSRTICDNKELIWRIFANFFKNDSCCIWAIEYNECYRFLHLHMPTFLRIFHIYTNTLNSIAINPQTHLFKPLLPINSF